MANPNEFSEGDGQVGRNVNPPANAEIATQNQRGKFRAAGPGEHLDSSILTPAEQVLPQAIDQASIDRARARFTAAGFQLTPEGWPTEVTDPAQMRKIAQSGAHDDFGVLRAAEAYAARSADPAHRAELTGRNNREFAVYTAAAGQIQNDLTVALSNYEATRLTNNRLGT